MDDLIEKKKQSIQKLRDKMIEDFKEGNFKKKVGFLG